MFYRHFSVVHVNARNVVDEKEEEEEEEEEDHSSPSPSLDSEQENTVRQAVAATQQAQEEDQSRR